SAPGPEVFEALARLAEEQAALRRVAGAAPRAAAPGGGFWRGAPGGGAGPGGPGARRAPPPARRAGAPLGARGPPPGPAPARAARRPATPWDQPWLGSGLPLDADNVVPCLQRTGLVARVDDWTGASGAVAAMAGTLGVRSAIAAPVAVHGRLWGTIIAATGQ